MKRGSDISDDESAYELILKDKEKLLSLTTRFVLFSPIPPCGRAGIIRMFSRSAR